MTVQAATADGTALAGTDYTALTPSTGTVHFPAGSASGTVLNVPVSLTNDTLCRGNRTFTVNLSQTAGATLLAGAGANTVTIIDDDVTCLAGSISTSGDHNPDGGSVVYSITLTNTGSQAQLDRPGDELTDQLSSLLTFLSASATSGTTTNSGNIVSWNGSIPAGGSVTVTINARTNLGTAGMVVPNEADFHYDRNNDGTNESSGAVSITFPVGTGHTNYFTVTPCRLVDTRNPSGPLGGPALTANTPRTFPVAGSCGVPSTALAVSLNVTVVAPSAAGSVALFPAFVSAPGTSTISYAAGQIRANNAVMPLNAGQVSALATQASGTANIIIDVNGYFQ